MHVRDIIVLANGLALSAACDGHERLGRNVVHKAQSISADATITEVFTETINALPSPPTPVSGFYNVTKYPREQKTNVTQFITEALAISTDWHIHQYFQDQCITQQLYPSLFTQPAGFVTPFSPFDNFYFVGQGFVSSWAYDTGEGLVVIDSLDSADEIVDIMLPALSKFGFSGSDIRHVIITHEHLDHYGGARYLKETFNSTIYASDVAWREMATFVDENTTVAVPDRDQTLVDRQVLRVGNTWFEAVLTPGHTPGTLSLIFPLTDRNGTKHYVAA